MVWWWTGLDAIPFWFAIVGNCALFATINARQVATMALITGVPDARDRGAYMAVSSSMQQFAGAVSSSVSGLLVVESTTGHIENYHLLGSVVVGAMVLTLAIPLRKFYHLEGLVTERHIDNMGKVMLATGFIVAYGYGMEVFMAWYSASHWEAFMMWNRMFGPMGWAYWVLITCNLAIPLTTLWSRKLRTSMSYMFFISIVVNTGMWFERFVIVVTSLYRDFLPSAWGTYRATKWDYMTYVGTLGLFTALFLLFVRFLPMIPMSEIRMMLPGAKITPKATAKAGD